MIQIVHIKNVASWLFEFCFSLSAVFNCTHSVLVSIGDSEVIQQVLELSFEFEMQISMALELTFHCGKEGGGGGLQKKRKKSEALVLLLAPHRNIQSTFTYGYHPPSKRPSYSTLY